MKIVYCGQFRDQTGYGVAARGYLKALDLFLQENGTNFSLKIYSSIASESKRLSLQEKSLIEKYEFKDDLDIERTLKEDYVFIWHVPPPMICFCDEKFKPSPNCKPSALKLLKASNYNVSLVAWETDKVPAEWQRVYDYYKPDMIITPSEWNKNVFSETGVECRLVPHVIEERQEASSPINNIPEDMLENKFVVLASSQWTHRKGFDVLLKAFLSEFGSVDDALLLLKTYEGPTHNLQRIKAEIDHYKNTTLLEFNGRPKNNNILVLPGFLSSNNITWLYEKCSIFALTSRGEGFGLPYSEALMKKKPVLVPKEGGHVDFIHPESAFFVDGHWDNCFLGIPPYESDGKYFECHITETRKQLREAYKLWKNNPKDLEKKGEIGYNHILNSEYDSYNIGKRFVNLLDKFENKNIEINSVKAKRKELKKKISKADTLEQKVALMKGAFKGETCYLLSCGPSLSDYDENDLREKLQDKLVLTVKQANNKFSDISDFHFFNCCNLPNSNDLMLHEHYKYSGNEPIVVASSNYDVGMRWSEYQKCDIFFKIPIRTEIDNEFLVYTKDFEKYCLDKTTERPCGPGIILETVLHTAVHLGVSKIIAIGYDLSKENPKKQEDHKHFYGETKDLFNRADVLPWEVKAHVDITDVMYEWLLSKEVELELASDKSALYEGIPRVEI